MDTLPDELKLELLEKTSVTLQPLTLCDVRQAPLILEPMFKCWDGLIDRSIYGRRLNDENYAAFIDTDSLAHDGVVWDDVVSIDEDSVLMSRVNPYDTYFCFDTNMRYICVYNGENYSATPVGKIEKRSHNMKSPLAAVCKAFSTLSLSMPHVETTCLIPRKQKIVLNDGPKESELIHTLVLTEAGDPDNILAYYKKKEEDWDYEGSDAE